ncbi:hypothetical protein [Salinibacterium sp. ZJ450]|uniref:hypothetical protein n=1 Tax=Salinibacterium sp. ZJ450 TaxID=2708338 RepID=UPI0014238775|nr:hypothetical protein [Salinibacterium sp. ZJ450]
MIEMLTQSFAAAAGTMILVFLVPIICAVSIGLIYIGLIRKKPGAVFIGVAFPTAAIALGLGMRVSGLSDPQVASTAAGGIDAMFTMFPTALMIAGLCFLVGVLPGMVKATRNR